MPRHIPGSTALAFGLGEELTGCLGDCRGEVRDALAVDCEPLVDRAGDFGAGGVGAFAGGVVVVYLDPLVLFHEHGIAGFLLFGLGLVKEGGEGAPLRSGGGVAFVAAVEGVLVFC